MNTYTISRWVYLAGIVLAVAFMLPVAWFPFGLTKVALFALGAAVAAGLFVWSGSMRDFLRSHGAWAAMLVLVLPLSYLLSWAFSTDRSIGLWGSGFETDTVLFVTLCAVGFLLSFGMFRTLRGVSQLTTVLFWTLAAAVLFQCVAIVVGPGAFFGVFSDRSVNLVGKWNDLGLLTSLLLILALIRLEWSAQSRLAFGSLVALAVVSALLLGVVNFPVAWALVLSASIVLAILYFLMRRGVPKFALAGVVVSVVFLFFGTALNTSLTKLFSVSSLEVRPSYNSSLQVITAARGLSLSRLVVGTGPNTFGESWLMHRPLEVNQSQFWNLDFNVGYSTFLTALGTVGVAGLLGWLMAPLLLLAGIIRAVRLRVLSREDTLAALGLSFASLALFAALLFYVPSQNIILLFFALAGAAFAFFWRQGQSAPAEESSLLHTLLAPLSGGVLVAAAAVLCIMSMRLVFSESYVNRGLLALNEGNAAQALALAQAADRFGATDNSLRLATDAGVAQLQVIAATTSTASSVQQLFTEETQRAIASGQAGVAHSPKNYRAYLSLGNVYAFLSTLKVQGALESARATYESAAALNPKNPSIPLLQARLEAAGGSVDGVQKYLAQSLTLKSDYTDAILMAVQLYIAGNDLQNATQAAVAAVRSAPGVPSLWFQLGVLLWTGNNSKDAASALEQAVALESDYANAKYFLGLSYWAEGQKDKAIAHFADLAQTNPDNAEVKTTLEKMRDGTQPLRPTPPTAETAPVGQ